MSPFREGAGGLRFQRPIGSRRNRTTFHRFPAFSYLTDQHSSPRYLSRFSLTRPFLTEPRSALEQIISMDQLPRDVVADVLALLPPRTLAVSRCVCREWRDVVDADARCRLRTDLLPVSVAGIFMMTNEAELPEFFVRPSMARKIASDLQSYLKMDKDDPDLYLSLAPISDCCNGLILLEDHVVNPATRQWMRLPPYPTTTTTLPAEEAQSCYYDSSYLVFDPTMSPHFEVFSMKDPLDYKDKLSGESEWPPLEYMVRVYSSNTQRWEERAFLREEEHTPTAAANVWSKLDYFCGWWHAVYRHGALYVYWTTLTFITRINVLTNKYQDIHLPPDINWRRCHQFQLGKSVNGVHFAVADSQAGLQVWFLDESGSKAEWVLKHVATHRFISHDQTDRPWILQHGPYDYDDGQEENNKEPTTAKKDSDWDSDADNAADIDQVEKYSCPYIEVLGFHPYRDIVFLVLSREVVAYYFNSSKIQHLGKLCFRYQYQMIQQGFIYTPTWIGELPGANYLVRKRKLVRKEEDLLHSIEDY